MLKRDSSPNTALNYSSVEPIGEGSRRFLLCTSSEWLLIGLISLLVTALALPWYSQISNWIGLPLLLMTTTLLHLIFTYSSIVSFPHVAILITGLQYVLAAWLSHYYPASNPTYDIGSNLPHYLAFASAVTAAVTMGWVLAFRKTEFPSSSPLVAPSTALLKQVDILFWMGIIACVGGEAVHLEGLAFVLVLCGNLRYVGALGRMLLNGPGWKWRIWLTLTLELLFTAGGGMFHSLLLWGTAVLLIFIYIRRPKKMTVMGFAVLGILLLPALQHAKMALRERLRSYDQVSTQDGIQNTIGLMNDISAGLVTSATGQWDQDFFGDMALRYNQGWIINRVMLTVPTIEPYAAGETLLTAIKGSLVPRFLLPDKHRAGGRAYMERYASYSLAENTSMNLGFAGEMYANFGYWGGVLGCLAYAFTLGLLYRWISVRAATSPLWWAFVPYIGLIALKAETGISEVLNWVVKAGVVTAIIFYSFPAIQASLATRPLRHQSSGSGGGG